MNFEELCELTQNSETYAEKMNGPLSINMNFLSFIRITLFLIALGGGVKVFI